MIAFLIVSCDKYSDLWKPMFHTLFKYWPDCPYKIYLASNTKIFNHPKVSNISFGEDKDYSTNLISILAQVEEERLIYWFDDVLLTKKVDTNFVQNIINEAVTSDLDHLKLSVDSPLYYGNRSEIFGPIKKGVKYRSAIGMALYKKSKLIEMIVPGESAWQLDKSTRADDLDINFYSLNSRLRHRNRPFNFINSVIKGKWIFGVKNFFKQEGLEVYYKNRKRLPLIDYLYIISYLFYIEIHFFLKKYPK